ncbi:MAG TPA: alpha/beta hydrolase [Frankiaceae bacterium]|jgi:pimeloyl-ACP methyl ester carboxylesterase|nr:alpha/beta hydrolase [Frankiaceae bacterium]
MPAPDPHPLPGSEVLVTGSTGGPLRLHVAEHGRDGGRLPLLMLAEPPATSYLWRDVARDLEREWRSFMPDLVGTGASERPPVRRAYAIDAQANALAGLLDVLGLPRVAVVASGLAGAIAVELAARLPERVAALALVGAVVHGDAWPTAGVLPLLPVGPGEAIFTTLRGSAPRARRKVAGLLATEAGPDLDHYADPLRSRAGARAMLRVFRSVDMQVLARSRELVGISPPPTLVLWGEDDALLSLEYGRRVATQLRAAWVPIAGAGHLLARERPERVAEELAGFLEGLA